MIDRYVARPKELENITLTEFAAWYIPCRVSQSTKKAIRLIDLSGKLIGCMRKRNKIAAIRYPRFKEDTENFFRSKLMLFMPWRREKTDLISGFSSYAESYSARKQKISAIEANFVKNLREFNEALEDLSAGHTGEDAWDRLAPGAMAEDAECILEGREEITNFDAVELLAEVDLPRQTQISELTSRFRAEQNRILMSTEEYCCLMRDLNNEQRKAVTFNRLWLKKYIHSYNKDQPEPDPYFVFVSGAGGVGKSHVIRLIQTDCIRLLRKCRRNGIDLFEPNDTCILLTAPTRTAAFNIHGLTIHSALLLRGHFSSKLSADNLNTLRNCLAKLTVIVIDEISMVGAELLLEVDQRLRQIKSSDKAFGGISLLAVGDLYQLSPVKQRAVFAISRNLRHTLYGSPWLDCVRMVELTRNMRQKDRQFSDMLNRIRVGNCTREDESVLRTRILNVDRQSSEYPTDIIHIFDTNQECDEHNLFCLTKLGSRVHELVAIDSKRDELTTLLDTQRLDLKPSETGGLRRIISLAVGAKVMLIANVNVSDGLSNGVIGSVRGIIEHVGKVVSVQVQFENPTVGRQA